MIRSRDGGTSATKIMDRKNPPPPQREFKPRPPRWNSPVWYLPLMFVLLWFWQEAVLQFSSRTIPYSEFKEHLRKNEVAECVVREDAIEGRIQPKNNPQPGSEIVTTGGSVSNTAPATTEPAKEFLFRTIRIEDPNLVAELEKAGVKFNGVRPSFLSQFLLAWILPIGVM